VSLTQPLLKSRARVLREKLRKRAIVVVIATYPGSPPPPPEMTRKQK